ncbi:carotenoid biosynthesis protein [Chitinophaga sp. CF118]|uniref:carotenoid biosynthesis protein n=1 Tax=Chitinophaga sp. CF118 TaxID=1884367 RepID=UPI0015A512EE|nr:carotenoid biosynthesis protein [Chitinophaga sp. CF118]
MYLLFIITLFNAWKKGIGHVSYLLGGVGFGLLLEYVNVMSSAGYKYGQFMLMLGHAPDNIPVCIGTSWGIIIYTSRLISDNKGLPLWAAAAFDSLLALSIDLSMDVVAYRLHMWHWSWEDRQLPQMALTGDWFGIPYGNFFGWLCVVFFYSLFARTLEIIHFTKAGAIRVWKAIIPLLSILISQLILWLTLFPVSTWLKVHFNIVSKEKLIFLLVLFPIMTIAGFTKKREVTPTVLPFITWLVPVWFHLYFFAWLFIGGFSRENKLMTFLCVTNLFIVLVIHWWIHIRKPNLGR